MAPDWLAGWLAGDDKDDSRVLPQFRYVTVGREPHTERLLEEEKLLSKESDNVLFEPYAGGHKIGYSYIKKIRGIIERKYQ